MADNEHDTHTTPDAGHEHTGPGNDHPQPPQQVSLPVSDGLDEANRSLAEALRLSFRLLKGAMVLLVIGFLVVSALFSVNPNEVALVLNFGKVSGDLATRERQPGFHWSWPYPISERIVVNTSQREEVVTFWYQGDPNQPINPRFGGSLNPEAEGYLISGDANIVHTKLLVRYHVQDAYNYVHRVSGINPDLLPNEHPERPMIRDLARSAAIRAAGSLGVDGLLGPQRTTFAERVRTVLNAHLTNLGVGLTVDNVLVEEIQPPRQVYQQFVEVRNAKEEMRAKEKNATAEYKARLTRAAGETHEQLSSAIDAEWQAVLDDNKQELPALRQTVESLLEQAGGRVREILDEALADSDAVVTKAQADAEYFSKLLPRYTENPQVVRTRLLMETMKALLERVNDRYVDTINSKEVRVMVQRDPREAEQQLNADQQGNQ